MAARVIGWIDLPKAIVLRQQYEVAAWHTDVRVEAGRYLITEGSNGSGRPCFTMTFPGVIVSSYTPALFGGNPIRSNVKQGTEHEDAGRAHVASRFYYDDFYFGYVAADVAKTGTYRIKNDADSSFVDCPIHIFGAAAVVTHRSWSVGDDSHFQPRTPDMPSHLCGFHTHGKRGCWRESFGFRPRLALPATTGARIAGRNV